jgi:mutator protein MutT
MKVTLVVLGLAKRNGRWFLQRRDPANTTLPGRWEFPGGKADEGESLEGALRRELREELAWKPSSFAPMECMEHRYPERLVRLFPFTCEGEFHINTELSWGWFTLEEMRCLPIPEANRALLERLS